MADYTMKLDESDYATLLAARISERTSLIQRNDAMRMAARASGPTAAAHEATVVAKNTEAAGYKSTFDSCVEAVKLKHAVAITQVEQNFDPVQGTLLVKSTPTAVVEGPGPAVERKRITIPDADCDKMTAAYILQCQASDEACDLQRKIAEAVAALPPSSDGSIKPEPPALVALRGALEAKQNLVKQKMSEQGAILSKLLAGETVTYSMRIDIASGEIVLGDKP